MRFTIKDVAEHAGVSTATVSRVLNGSPNVTENLVRRVHSTIAELGYRPNSAARTLKTKKTNTIGILIPDISNSYFMQIAKGIEDVIAPYGFSLIFASSDEDSAKEAKLLEVLSEYRVDCLVLATAGGNDEQIKRTKNLGTPIVLVDRLPASLLKDIDYVVGDNYDAAYRLTVHLMQQGAKSFGLIHGPMAASTAFQRALGCREALKDSGVPARAIQEHYGDFSREAGACATRKLLSEGRPEAIIALNNSMAVGAIWELAHQDLVPGEDILFGSYGDLEIIPPLPKPLPFIEQQPRNLGVRVGEIVRRRLLEQDTGPFTQVVPQQLIV